MVTFRLGECSQEELDAYTAASTPLFELEAKAKAQKGGSKPTKKARVEPVKTQGSSGLKRKQPTPSKTMTTIQSPARQRNRYWREDFPSGPAVGYFQPTECIQRRGERELRIFAPSLLEFLCEGAPTEVLVLHVGTWEVPEKPVMRAVVMTYRKQGQGWAKFTIENAMTVHNIHPCNHIQQHTAASMCFGRSCSNLIRHNHLRMRHT